jgi:hypothetical protein
MTLGSQTEGNITNSCIGSLFDLDKKHSVAWLQPSDNYYKASGRILITAAGRRIITDTRLEPSDGRNS